MIKRLSWMLIDSTSKRHCKNVLEHNAEPLKWWTEILNYPRTKGKDLNTHTIGDLSVLEPRMLSISAFPTS